MGDGKVGLTSALLAPDTAGGLWLLCGPPASGKSTFRHGWWNGPVVSPDELRLAMFGASFDPRREGAVWARVRQQVGRLLPSGTATLLDATNVSRSARRQWLKFAHNAQTQAYALACWDPGRTPVAELLSRNRQRPDPVPEARVISLAAAWQPPSLAEGFGAVWTIIAQS
jgi:predicted kinase